VRRLRWPLIRRSKVGDLTVKVFNRGRQVERREWERGQRRMEGGKHVYEPYVWYRQNRPEHEWPDPVIVEEAP
jgi:hypothetical protein